MDYWTVRGGNRLEGSCRVQGSKNASLPILAAAVLSGGETELTNVPRLRDIDAALRILRHLGCRTQQEGNRLYIDARGLVKSEVPDALMQEMRSSVIFMGALLARCGFRRCGSWAARSASAAAKSSAVQPDCAEPASVCPFPVSELRRTPCSPRRLQKGRP